MPASASLKPGQLSSTQLKATVGAEALPVMEDFYSVQGEGYFQGHAAYFIRLGGCDVGCVWCDVKESWDAEAFPKVPVIQLAEKARLSGCPIAVVTGGEPAMYDLTFLTAALKGVGVRSHIETSGAYPLTGTWDWVCFSPKKFKFPHPSVPRLASELKVIVFNQSDFEWAEEYAAKVSPGCELFLQPEWSKHLDVVPLIVDYVRQNPKWKISLQIHKYMGIP